MNRIDARQLALFLLQEHMCDKWYFEWSTATKTFAKVTAKQSNVDGTLYCRRLRLSKHLTELNSYEIVREVLLHEIAHIKAGIHTGHGYKWRRWCHQLGIPAMRLYTHHDLHR